MYLNKLVIVLFLLLGGWSSEEPSDKAQDLVDAAIEYHGSEILAHSIVDFNFRGHAYHVKAFFER